MLDWAVSLSADGLLPVGSGYEDNMIIVIQCAVRCIPQLSIDV